MHSIGQMNILMEGFAALVSIVVLVLLATGDDRKSKLNRLFMRIVMCNIAALLSDATAWGFEGGTSAHGIIITRAAMFSAYGLAYLMIPLSLLQNFKDFERRQISEARLSNKRWANRPVPEQKRF